MLWLSLAILKRSTYNLFPSPSPYMKHRISWMQLHGILKSGGIKKAKLCLWHILTVICFRIVVPYKIEGSRVSTVHISIEKDGKVGLQYFRCKTFFFISIIQFTFSISSGARVGQWDSAASKGKTQNPFSNLFFSRRVIILEILDLQYCFWVRLGFPSANSVCKTRITWGKFYQLTQGSTGNLYIFPCVFLVPLLEWNLWKFSL